MCNLLWSDPQDLNGRSVLILPLYTVKTNFPIDFTMFVFELRIHVHSFQLFFCRKIRKCQIIHNIVILQIWSVDHYRHV